MKKKSKKKSKKKTTKTRKAPESSRAEKYGAKWKPEYARQVETLSRLGAIDREIADFFEVSDRTIREWKKKHADFREARKRGGLVTDSEIANNLYLRAMGYETCETTYTPDENGEMQLTKKVYKSVAPDVTACIFWLKNRRPDLWRDVKEVTGAEGAPLIPAEPADRLEAARRIAFALALGSREKEAVH